MELPKEKTKPKANFAEMNTLIYSNPKVGKSTFCAQIPGALFAPTEEGLNYLEVSRIPLVERWEDILELGKSLSSEEHEFKVLVVDTVDQLFSCCEEYICKREGVKKIGDVPYGAGYKMARKEFIRVMTRFNAIGMGLIFTSHAKMTEVKTKTSTYTRQDTSLSPSVSEAICGFMDHIFYAYIDENKKRIMRTKPTKYVNAGDRSGKLPEVLEFEYNTFERSFKEAINGTDSK